MVQLVRPVGGWLYFFHMIRHRVRPIGLVVAVAWTALACSPTAMLRQSLPVVADGVRLDNETVVDDSFASGHPIDDVITVLGKRRLDTSAVFRTDAQNVVVVGGIVVQGVAGGQLLDTMVQNWQQAAVTNRTDTTVNGRPGWLLVIRPDRIAFLYVLTDTVYIAIATERGQLDRIVADMP